MGPAVGGGDVGKMGSREVLPEDKIMSVKVKVCMPTKGMPVCRSLWKCLFYYINKGGMSF